MAGKVLYYPMIVLMSSGRPLRAGPPCDDPRQARDYIRGKLAAGVASMGVVCRFAGGRKEPLDGWVFPEAARKVVRHWLAIVDAVGGPP